VLDLCARLSRAGAFRIKLAELSLAVIRCRYPLCEEMMVKGRMLWGLVDLFFGYEFHSLYHSLFERIVEAIFDWPSAPLIQTVCLRSAHPSLSSPLRSPARPC
jgi:hypothetical protein